MLTRTRPQKHLELADARSPGSRDNFDWRGAVRVGGGDVLVLALNFIASAIGALAIDPIATTLSEDVALSIHYVSCYGCDAWLCKTTWTGFRTRRRVHGECITNCITTESMIVARYNHVSSRNSHVAVTII